MAVLTGISVNVVEIVRADSKYNDTHRFEGDHHKAIRK